ncbi:MAG: hypothetical protein M3R36_14230 [Bacteroidota bacterium]|nr:hypothetical protein [Bacteroidota bacterium]
MKEKLKFLFSLIVLFILFFGCGKLGDMAGDSADKLYFCETYDAGTDKCDGKNTKYTEGFLTVMVDIRPSKKKMEVDKVNINITDTKTGEVVETYPFDVKPDMDYAYFEKVDFKKPGKFKVSALKPDGTVIVSNEIEIIED